MARSPAMKIEKIYLYPIKSFRAIELDSAILTQHGFPYDRTFMLLHIVDDKENPGEKKHKNMSVADYNEMVRFFPSLNDAEAPTTMTVTYHPPLHSTQVKTSIDIPLTPDTSELEQVEVTMHLSRTKAFKMPTKYNAWLSSCFGYDVILAYISDNLREVRMSSDKYKAFEPPTTNSNWLSSVTSAATQLMLSGGTTTTPSQISAIRFSDVAPYLLVSSTSLPDVSARLPAQEGAFDVTKFRPNIVVSGAAEAWEEDFWAEVTLAPDSDATDGAAGGDPIRIELEHNCCRCRSINIDYATGAQGTGEAGKMLAKLAKDRRVDVGAKWSPVFGRYGFLHPRSEGRRVRVGDGVWVSRVNEARTGFDWEGLHTLPAGKK